MITPEELREEAKALRDQARQLEKQAELKFSEARKLERELQIKALRSFVKRGGKYVGFRKAHMGGSSYAVGPQIGEKLVLYNLGKKYAYVEPADQKHIGWMYDGRNRRCWQLNAYDLVPWEDAQQVIDPEQQRTSRMLAGIAGDLNGILRG